MILAEIKRIQSRDKDITTSQGKQTYNSQNEITKITHAKIHMIEVHKNWEQVPGEPGAHKKSSPGQTKEEKRPTTR